MEILLTNPDGIVLDTEATYVAEDITITPVLGAKSVTPTQSVQEVAPDTGQVGLKKVTVGAVQTETTSVTPAKGTQTVQPSSGKFFDEITVEAIPDDYVIPSGTQQITANGTYDVSGKASAVVNVEPSLEEKTVTITENGTTEVTPSSGKDGMSKVTVTTNVPTASAVEEVATASAMDALLVEANVGKYYKFTGTTDSNYTNGDLYLVENDGGGAVTHSLTFNEDDPSSGFTIRKGSTSGEIIHSPYELQSGDELYVVTARPTIDINGISYTATELQGITKTFENTDIDIVGGGVGPQVLLDSSPFIIKYNT